MRHCFRTTTGQELITNFASYTPIDDAIATAYQDSTGSGPADLDGCRYHLFFSENYQTSRWNKAVIENMLEMANGEQQKYHLDGDLNINVHRAIMWDFIKQAQCSWSAYNVCLTNEGRAETQGQARICTDGYRECRSNDTHLNSCKHQACF
ncbi:hypothetical protein GYMLUDRAFT_393672 [Collybiopsis luxurians FD-317 M1]|uniref:Unplaced genomic scaffold GYMLUscaffold_114, whole genome shotgun sequence n=1 Tax=Collybiopsis luxurians FD-317 M1 TaxID=944289 RepID=A0A0D0BAY8_9AGAR|nr:hypothetical protein GYMLUDRAFT_393672 [Collybiopsis luxurians FD-317 M1]